MRTTLAIDDDVLQAAKAIAEHQHRSVGAVISELARRALDRPRSRSSRKRYSASELAAGCRPRYPRHRQRAARRLGLTFLLDVNVLIALIDPAHVARETAHAWFEREGKNAWASCPLTENGGVRIVGHQRYPNNPGSPTEVGKIMGKLRALPAIVFGPTTSAFWIPAWSTWNGS